MSTTSLFVEILIIGLEALVWLGLLLSAVWKNSPFFDMLEAHKAYSALVTTLLLAFAYVIGILIDRLADSFFKIFRYHRTLPPPAPVGEMRLHIMHHSEGMAKFIDYQRSRLRIARATVFNLCISIPVAVIWLVRFEIRDALVYSIVIGVGAIAFVLSLTAARRIDEAQMNRLIEAYEIITGPDRNTNDSR